MIPANKKVCSNSLLLTIVLVCFLAACSSGKDTGATQARAIKSSTAKSQASAVVQAETAADATALGIKQETSKDATESAENAMAGGTVVQASVEDAAKTTVNASPAETVTQSTIANSPASVPPSSTASAKGDAPSANHDTAENAETNTTSVRDTTVEATTTEPTQKLRGRPIGSDSDYNFYLEAEKSVYAVDSAGKRTDCTMLSDYSGWAAYFTFNSDLYIFSEYSEARKACAIPPRDIFLGSVDFHVYYISSDYSKVYSINEAGEKHDSAIILYGGNYYFALDSSIYTAMTNAQGLKKLYSEHSVEVGPHNEHILALARIENGIIYYTDESTGDVLKCQYNMAESKAYFIDPATGKADPR
ncbi:MAG TPA: hypothetical protein VHT96_01010 [Clostridia bacterium]|nr:hypothetical protein [Clostridia bacterium]